ncbi:hypothetical protein [Vreelandella nigrificans]|uniref:Uncharacterized protein n=1 Tax=Vreelandella nigrificans TaxID=2042704 RepID=A0A2A4HSW4_9GAMM|nr:hypothetical protein [Halomonas nigrificans]PCF97497.1 hypothetical protein CPA45_01830 [Halomonas nigrificans]
MKYQKVQKQLDEREKLRKFRELDDAFAQALRQLDDPNNSMDIPTGKPVRSLADLEADDQAVLAEENDRVFKERFKALIGEYGLSDRELSELIQTLLTYERWELQTVPVIKS